LLLTPATNDPVIEKRSPTPRELLPAFYKQYDLSDDGGQSSFYVKIEFTKKLFIYFPNFDARRKAVFKHDVHHIVTGYTSTFNGETEISAWEIASGCRHYWAAFLLDLHGMSIGALYYLPGIYKAFVKGRRTKNLYNDAFTDEQLLDIPVQKIRESLLLNEYRADTKGSLSDLILFLLVLLIGAIYSILSLVLIPFVLLFTIYVMVNNKMKRR
jgi:hypothetical protein